MSSWTPDRQTPVVFARLSGDYNPVHMDEEHARSAGFPTVIIHGMCVVGASARAAHLAAPGGSVTREIDVRFAKPVLPDQQVSFETAVREKGERLRVTLTATLPDATRIMSPAAFTFGPAEGVQDVPAKVVLDRSPEDVLGDPYRFTSEQLDDYRRITAPTETVDDEGIPPMACLLGMTGALEKAFRGVEPAQPGTWVHLRQQGVFYRPIEAETDYICRIQGGLTIVRNSKVGAHVTIPFVVETADGDDLVSTGACVLLYSFDKEAQ